MKNRKGFTLVELLAVIVILGILAAVAILSISSILVNARKDTYVANANAAISAARNDYMIDNPTKFTWTLAEINELLEKDLVNTPFGGAYAGTSYVIRAQDGDFGICLIGSTAADGAIPKTAEKDLNRDIISLETVTCGAVPEDQPADIATWVGAA